MNKKCTQAVKKPDLKTPVAEIVTTLKVKVGTRVRLDGSRSVGYSGDGLSYAWELTPAKDSKASLNDTKAAKPTFEADAPGKYTVTLKVKDRDKESTAAQVEIEAFKDNVPPEAKIDPKEASAKAGDKVDLDGSKSTDADSDKLTYKWSLASKPDKSQATVSGTEDKVSLTPDVGGLYVVQLEVDDGNGGKSTAQSFITATQEPPAPKLTTLTPNAGPIGGNIQFNIDGEGFIYGAKATIDGKDFTKVRYVNDKQLTVWLDLAGWKEGKFNVKVTNPDKKESNTLEFEVTKPGEPTISHVGPPLVVSGQRVRLSVEGTNFVMGAKVSFDGKDLQTEYTSDKLLNAILTVPKDGEYDVVVENTDGQKSKPYKFRVSSVLPIIDKLSFQKIGNDCAKETIKVAGRNLLPGVKVQLVEKKPPAGQTAKKYDPTNLKYVSMTELEVDFDFTKIPKGDYELVITNAGSDASDKKDFEISDPLGAPLIASFVPTEILAQSKATGYLVGVNVVGAEILIDGKPAIPAPINSSTWRLELDLSTTQPGDIKLELKGLCGKSSPPITIKVVDIPTPKIESITPEEALLEYKGTFKLRGDGFHPQAQLLSNGTAIKGIKFINNTLLEFPSTDFTKPGTFKLVVENPSAKKSQEFEFKVNHTPEILSITPEPILAGATGNFTIKGKNFETGAKVTVDGQSLTGVTRTSLTELTAPQTPFTKKGTYKIVVENPTNTLKSKEFALNVFDKTDMVITKQAWSGLFYVHGINIRDTSSKTDMVVEKGTTQVFRKLATNSAVYPDAVYLSESDFSAFTSPPYTIKLCRLISGSEACTPKVPWEYEKDWPTSGPGTPSTKQPFHPIIIATNPITPTTSFVIPATNPPTKISFEIIGNYFESDSKVYINGKDSSTVTGAKISIATGKVTVQDYPVSELALGDSPIEITNNKGRSNTMYLHLAQAPYMRIIWGDEMLISTDTSYSFLFYGQGFTGTLRLVSGGNPIQNAGKDLSVTAGGFRMSSASWTDATKLTPGLTPIQVDTTGVKSNIVQLRTVGSGDYGTTPLGIRSFDSYASSFYSQVAGVAPYEGEETEWRIGVVGFVTGAGIGGKGKVLIDGKAISDYTTGVSTSSHISNGFSYIRIKKQAIPGTPRLIPVQLENPGGVKSNPYVVTLLPKGAMRLTHLQDGFYFSKILRPGAMTQIRVSGDNFKDADIFLAGMPVSVNYRYHGSSYEYATLDVELPNIPDGIYPMWAKRGSTVSNTILVQVYKDGGTGSVPRVQHLSPLIVDSKAVAKTSGKVRFAIGGAGMTKDMVVKFNGKSYPVEFIATNYVFVPLDLTGLAAGKYKIQVEAMGGKAKTHEYEFEIE